MTIPLGLLQRMPYQLQEALLVKGCFPLILCLDIGQEPGLPFKPSYIPKAGYF
jgi:hypothetical protein